MSEAVLENRGRIFSTERYKVFALNAIGIFGIIGGLVLISSGMILTIIAYFDRVNIYDLDTTLFLTAAALIAAGAHAFDRRESYEKLNRSNGRTVNFTSAEKSRLPIGNKDIS